MRTRRPLRQAELPIGAAGLESSQQRAQGRLRAPQGLLSVSLPCRRLCTGTRSNVVVSSTPLSTPMFSAINQENFPVS